MTNPDNAASGARPRLGYVLSRFPYLPETFTLREMLALERLGWDVDVYGIQHQRDAVKHPEALRLEAAAEYLTFNPLARPVRDATLRLLRRDPARYARLLRLTVRGNLASRDFLVKALALFPGAIELAERMRRRGVAHLHAQYGTHSAMLALLAADLLGIGFSFGVHAHDLYVDSTMLAEKLHRARFVAAISEFNRGWLQRLARSPHDQAKIHVVRCGVDVEAYAYRPRPPRRTGDVRGPFRILAVGSLQPYKGHEHLVRACARLAADPGAPSIECTVIGGGALKPSLEALASSLGVAERVRFAGPRDQHGVRQAMDEADLLVLPSVVAANGQMEGIPVVLMEAMALGLPVIASQLSGIPELVRPADTGVLVPPADPAALSQAILASLRDRPAALARAERARRLVEQEFALDTNAARLSALFEQSVSLTPMARPGPGPALARSAA